jgi:carbon catabolite-derepressing protein kinase
VDRPESWLTVDTGGAEESSAMEGFMASSPPAWNAEIPRDQSEGGSDESDDDEDLDIQDIPNAHFDVLDTSRSTGKS